MEILQFDGGEVCEEFAEGVLSTGVPYLDKPAATLFRAGKHKGRLYTEADLDKIASSFSRPAGDDWTVPVQVDHSDSARDTAGHVRSVYREGNLLKGSIRIVGSDAIDRVKGGTYRKLSVGLRPNLSLHHVAITPHPYITDAQLYNEEDNTVADTVTPETPKADSAAPVTFKSVEALQAEFAAKTAEFEAKQVAMEARLKAQEETIRFAELTGKVDTFSAQGKTVAIMRDAELALLKTFSDEQLALYEALKAKQPAIVNFSVLGSQDSTRPGEDSSLAADEQWANEMAKAHGFNKNGGAE